jgi:oxygen-dependent protoporphyrinogen oxidase
MKISIIGAGFSGLSLAYFLLKKGFEVEIHEASSAPGGMIQTIQTDRGLVETAATSILLTSDLEEIVKDIKINYITPKKKSRKKYISINHSPKRMPLRFIDLFSLLKGIFNILFNKIKSSPRKGESLADWADRVFNKSIRKKLVSPAMLGIYADSSENLSATLVLKKVFSAKKKNKSKGPVNFDGGMASFIKALEKYLLKKGATIHYNSKVSLINKPKNPYVIATSFKQATDLNLELPKLPLKSMSTATLFFDGSPPLEGFGTLFPIEEGLNSQGVLFNTSMFEKRTNTGYSETWILSEKTKFSDEQLLELILKDRSQVFKSTERPKDFILHHWQDAFPLYGLELESLLSTERQLPKSVYLTGNYLGSLGLSGIIEQNNRLSQEMAMELL